MKDRIAARKDRTAIALMGAAIIGTVFAVEQANANPSGDADCAVAVARWDGYNPNATRERPYRVLVDGAIVADGYHEFSGPTGSVTVPLNLKGTHTVRVEVGEGYDLSTLRPQIDREIVCPGDEPANPPVTPPTPTPVEPTPPKEEVTPPDTDTTPDCSYLRKVRAGRKWLVKFGCITPPPTGPGPFCDWANKVKAGPKWYARRGLTFRCRIVKTPRTTPPAVTGEYRPR